MFAPWTVVVLLLSEALLIFGSFIAATYQLVEADASVYLLYDGGLARVIIVTASILFGLYLVDLYTHIYYRSRIWLVQQLSLVIGAAFLLQAFLSYANRGLILPKWVMIAGSLLTFLTLTLWRIVYGQIILKAVPKERIILLGISPAIRELAEHYEEHPELGGTLAGAICSEDESSEAHCPWLGTPDQLMELAEVQQPSRLVVNTNRQTEIVPYSQLLSLRLKGVIIEDAASAFERTFGRILVDESKASEFLFGGRLGPGPFLAKVQAAYSLVLAVVGVIVTGPVMLLTALVVKLSSPGPVFFKQNRVGLNGTIFKVYKFRSMYVNVDPFTGPRGRDPRITPVGWYLRKFRLDELPQFFNVLRGEMLVVGPRPEIPEFTKVFIEKVPVYQQRLLVKPGITGWAQINHKLEEQLEDTIRKLGYDLYYLKYTSLPLDLFVIFHTIKIMLLSRGAR